MEGHVGDAEVEVLRRSRGRPTEAEAEVVTAPRVKLDAVAPWGALEHDVVALFGRTVTRAAGGDVLYGRRQSN